MSTSAVWVPKAWIRMMKCLLRKKHAAKYTKMSHLRQREYISLGTLFRINNVYTFPNKYIISYHNNKSPVNATSPRTELDLSRKRIEDGGVPSNKYAQSYE